MWCLIVSIPDLCPLYTLDPSKATGLDGLGPKIFKLAINSLSSIIAILINKSIHTGHFSNEMNALKCFQFLREEMNLDLINQIIDIYI